MSPWWFILIVALPTLVAVAVQIWARHRTPVDPLTDPERLDATYEYLELNMADAFDILTAAAAVDLKVSVCEFNVVTEERQYHLGKYPSEGNRSDPIVDSGCRFVVREKGTIAITDCASDPDFYDLLGVRTGVFASYLGVPLNYKGQCVGSFCVADVEPREWTVDELRTLRRYAAQTGLEHD